MRVRGDANFYDGETVEFEVTITSNDSRAPMNVQSVTQVRILKPDNTILSGSTNQAFTLVSTGIYRRTISTVGFDVGTYTVVVKAEAANGGVVIETSQFVIREVPGS